MTSIIKGLALVALAFLVTSAALPPAQAATYYVSSSTTSTGPCSSSTPCEPAAVWSRVAPGDTVIFRNGTYKGSDYMLDPPADFSGTQSNPLTVRAETDGGVLIDGQFERTPVDLDGNDWFIVEGINACCSAKAVVHLRSDANRNIVRRVVAWDAKDSGLGVFDSNNSNYNLFEDCAGFGVGRKIFTGTEGDNVTLRRTWARWEGNTTQGPKMAYTMFYHAQYRTCENCIGTWDSGSMPATYYLTTDDGALVPPPGCGSRCGQLNGCTQIDQPHGGLVGDRNDYDLLMHAGVYGSIFYLKGQTSGTMNCYCQGCSERDAFFSFNGGSETSQHDGLTVQNVAVFVDPSNPKFDWIRPVKLGPGDSSGGPPDYLSVSDVTGIGKASNEVDDEWNATDVEHAQTVSGLDDSIYVGDGARVCYRYLNRVEQVGQKLWPWPMQDRILAATTMAASSVHRHMMNVCNDTGCQAQLVTDPHAVANVMADIVSTFGPIPSACFEGSSGDPDELPPAPEIWRTDKE